MKILVFLEHDGGEIGKSSLGVLSKAASLGEAAGVVLGTGAVDAAAKAAGFGASAIYAVDEPALSSPLPQPRVDALAQLVREQGFDTVLLSSSVLASDVASGLAARLEAGLNWGLVDLKVGGGGLLGVQSALGDSVYVDCDWTSPVRIGLVRSGSFEPVPADGSSPVESVSVSFEEFSTAASFLGRESEASEGPSIEEAEIIVAAGRGLGGPDNFAGVEALARELGGAVATTRAVVDAGWYPYATQVGQTGKTVAPKLYLAVGISGAIQHKVGMQGSGTIVAINKDGNAPIFDFCDLGVVGDLNEIVPRLTELVKTRKAG